jgi:hypothetical protein
MAIHACRYQQREEGTVQEAESARLGTTRRAHEYIPALAGRHYGSTNDVRPDRQPDTGTSASTERTHHEDRRHRRQRTDRIKARH